MSNIAFFEQPDHPVSMFVVRSHRGKDGMDMASVRLAQRHLSMNAFQLYMHLELAPVELPRMLWPSQISAATSLDERTLREAMCELERKCYLTPGTLQFNGQLYPQNVYHFWERPALRSVASVCSASGWPGPACAGQKTQLSPIAIRRKNAYTCILKQAERSWYNGGDTHQRRAAA